MLFKHEEQAFSFLDYLNNKLPNIKFTVEHEAGDKLPFLDCSVCRVGDRFACSLYRKPTFSRLGMIFFSYCAFKLKMNCVWTLLSRAHKVCTSYILLHNELCFLKVFFSLQ